MGWLIAAGVAGATSAWFFRESMKRPDYQGGPVKVAGSGIMWPLMPRICGTVSAGAAAVCLAIALA